MLTHTHISCVEKGCYGVVTVHPDELAPSTHRRNLLLPGRALDELHAGEEQGAEGDRAPGAPLRRDREDVAA